MTKKIIFEHIPLAQLPERILTQGKSSWRPVVLVVDDERIIADTLSAILELNGYATLIAYDAESALRIGSSCLPDLLISDVVMPGTSGVELAMALRQTCSNCKILLFSGQAATVDLLASARAAGHDFTALSKPIHPNAMLAHVSQLVPQFASQYLA